MAESPKIISFDAARPLLAQLREQGRRIVQSHGVFDLVHPGHISHLEEARALGDVLVVTLTADQQVRKGPGRPLFNERLRLAGLAGLACVGYVVWTPFPGPGEAIECVRPHFYCKGKEYEDPDFDLSGQLKLELETIRRVGGQVRFVGSVKASSTRLLNQHFDHLGLKLKEFCNALSLRYSRRNFHDALEGFASL